MKKYLLVLSLIAILSCKKTSSPAFHDDDIVLYNQDTSIIKTHIQGKWKLHYREGGNNELITYPNATLEFRMGNPDSLIVRDKESPVPSFAQISWKKEPDYFHSSDSSFHFDAKPVDRGTWILGVEGIANDTLVLYMPTLLGWRYHLTRIAR